MVKMAPLEFNIQINKRIALMGFIITLILSLILRPNALAQEAESKLEKIKNQIHILNLLNGLELDKGQMQLVLDGAYQAQDIRLKTKDVITQKERKVISAYNEVLKVTHTGTLVIPEDIAFSVHKINQELDEIKEAAEEKLMAITIKIKNNLEPHQLYALGDYKPCIIPPIKQGRIGQAANPKGFVKVLENVRSLSEDRYNDKKEEIAQKAINRLQAKVPRGFIIEEEKLTPQLLEKMNEVRAMSDIDFALKKAEIAQDIKAQLLPEKPAINIGVKIEHFLLQPEIIPILEQRLTSR